MIKSPNKVFMVRSPLPSPRQNAGVRYEKQAVSPNCDSKIINDSNWRWKTSYPIVKAKRIGPASNNIIVEPIAGLLSRMKQLSAPQLLYVLKETCIGLEYLITKYGPFLVDENAICLTPQGCCKIWIDPDFTVETLLAGQRCASARQSFFSLLQTLQNKAFPNVNILVFFEKLFAQKNLTSLTVLNQIRMYTKKHKVIFVSRLQIDFTVSKSLLRSKSSYRIENLQQTTSGAMQLGTQNLKVPNSGRANCNGLLTDRPYPSRQARLKTVISISPPVHHGYKNYRPPSSIGKSSTYLRCAEHLQAKERGLKRTFSELRDQFCSIFCQNESSNTQPLKLSNETKCDTNANGIESDGSRLSQVFHSEGKSIWSKIAMTVLDSSQVFGEDQADFTKTSTVTFRIQANSWEDRLDSKRTDKIRRH